MTKKKIRKQHEAFPIATGGAYEYNQPTTMVHIGMCQRIPLYDFSNIM